MLCSMNKENPVFKTYQKMITTETSAHIKTKTPQPYTAKYCGKIPPLIRSACDTFLKIAIFIREKTVKSTNQNEYIDWLRFLPSLSDFEVHQLVETDNEFEVQLLASLSANIALYDSNTDIAASLVETQYKAQMFSYSANFPGSQRWLIYRRQEKTGRLWIWLSKDALHLLDIIILPGSQNKGLGTQIIRALINYSKSTQRVFKLSVEVRNTGAQSLYSRLGLQITNKNDTHLEMETP